MKIKLAILEKDSNYLNRLVAAFTNKYADKVEIYSFSDEAIAMKSLKNAKIDVFIASDVYDIDISKVPKKCGFAYFVDSPDIDTYKDQRTICKFQKAEMIYKEALGIVSDKVSDSTSIKFDSDSPVSLITFTSASGGVGCSTVAAAYARYLVSRGIKTLYINMEQFGSANSFFSGEGQFDFRDVVFAVKRKKSNLSLKLESIVKHDASGVYFFSTSENALDVLELNQEDVATLFDELKLIGSYNYIVLDINFNLSEMTVEILKKSNRIVFVSDGSDISNNKFERAYRAIESVEERNSIPIMSKIALLYNKFSNKTSKTFDAMNLEIIGGAPKYEHAADQQIIQQLISLNLFEKLI